ncbi:MAG: hypothetical protein KatS3mg035_0045 [Bacteroidia bacterium]|nr:MAG: hypothetical protein KatS3mg035_0045 [Bacteroidia bacterium]
MIIQGKGNLKDERGRYITKSNMVYLSTKKTVTNSYSYEEVYIFNISGEVMLDVV